MIENKGRYPNSGGAAKRHLEESLASGRITRLEAGVIEHFFATGPSSEWPSSGLQRRMQASGGREPLGVTHPKDHPDRKS
jgi:hypothetical protein